MLPSDLNIIFYCPECVIWWTWDKIRISHARTNRFVTEGCGWLAKCNVFFPMAERHVKQALEEEITCPLCLDILQEPKKLPCDHVFCKECLEKLANRSLNASISCPECRTPAGVPKGGAGNFPTAFRLNRLIEAFQQADVREEVDVAAVAGAKCKDHKTEQLVLYCDTCRILICRDCVLATKNHTGHKYGYINEMKDNLQDKLVNVVVAVETQSQTLSKSLYEIAEVESDIAACKRHCQEEIEQGFRALHRTLERSEQVMKDVVAKQIKSASATFVEKKKNLLSVHSEVMTVVSKAKNSLKESDGDFLMKHFSIQQQLELLQEKLSSNTLMSVPERPELTALKVMTDKELEQHLKKYNVLYVYNPTEWQFSGSILNGGEVGKRYTLTIESCRRGKHRKAGFFEVELVCTRDKSITIREVLEHSQDCFTVNIKPQTRGRHELSIKVNGMHIPNSPFAVFIHMPPKQLSKPITEISGLQRPTGLWCFESKMLASEWGQNRILKSPTAAVDKLTTLVELKGVNELTSDPLSSAIYATTDKNQVHKLTLSGDLIKSVGGRGKLGGQFDFPRGLRVSKQGELYVCDSYNNRIQIFDLDLNFKRSFGVTGTRKGQFSFPSDVEFDTSRKIYIVDHMNHRVQVFTAGEVFLYMVGDYCNKPFNNPISLAIHKELLYITEMRGHRVSVMKTSGELVTRIGDGHLQTPEGIAIDEDGYVFVTSHCSKVITF